MTASSVAAQPAGGRPPECRRARQPQQARPARAVVRASADPPGSGRCRADGRSARHPVPGLRSPVRRSAPKATNSAAPSVRSTIAAARSPRAPANLDSLRRVRTPVSQGTTVRRQHQGHGQDGPGGRQHPPHQDHRQRSHQRGDGEGGDHPDDQILKRVDVLDDAGQQITPPEGGQAGGSQPLEPLVHLHPQVGEQPECGVMTDQSLLIPEEAAGEPEELHPDDGHRQMGFVGMLGRPRDEPCRGGDEPDIGSDGTRAEQGDAGPSDGIPAAPDPTCDARARCSVASVRCPPVGVTTPPPLPVSAG